MNRCCKPPLDSNGNGAIEVNVVMIIITVVVLLLIYQRQKPGLHDGNFGTFYSTELSLF